MIHDARALFTHFGIMGDPDDCVRQLKRLIYKETACGAWVEVTDRGMTLGSIVEGSDAEVPGITLVFPFTSEDVDRTISEIESLADMLWEAEHE